MINYEIGDLFHLINPNKPLKIVAHVCNNIGGWGSGFVIPLARHWPQTERAYREWHEKKEWNGNPFRLGQIQYVQATDRISVVNMIAQHQTITTNPKPIRYVALITCMLKVGELASEMGAEIHSPMFASGLAGGNWKFIEELIEEIWCSKGIPVTIYKLEEDVCSVNIES